MPALIVDLDKIRAEAHRYGWRNAPYNPFGRVRSNESRPGDLEEDEPTTVSALGRQPGNESPQSPTRIGTDKDEDISGSTVADGSVNGDGLLRRRAPEPSLPPQRTNSEMEEERKKTRKEILSKKIPVGQQIKTVLFPHWYTINWLLVAVPVGIGLNYAHGVNPLAVFIINFLAIIPLAGILSFSTEELALRVGETLGGLLNATFG